MRQRRTGWDGRWDVIPCASLRERRGVTLSASGLARFISRRYTASANLRRERPSRRRRGRRRSHSLKHQNGVVPVLERLAIRKLTAKTGVESRERPLGERAGMSPEG
jgi:hypothetical protein